MKNSNDTIGNRPATCPFVAQCLKQPCQCVPLYSLGNMEKRAENEATHINKGHCYTGCRYYLLLAVTQFKIMVTNFINWPVLFLAGEKKFRSYHPENQYHNFNILG